MSSSNSISSIGSIRSPSSRCACCCCRRESIKFPTVAVVVCTHFDIPQRQHETHAQKLLLIMPGCPFHLNSRNARALRVLYVCCCTTTTATKQFMICAHAHSRLPLKFYFRTGATNNFVCATQRVARVLCCLLLPAATTTTSINSSCWFKCCFELACIAPPSGEHNSHIRRRHATKNGL